MLVQSQVDTGDQMLPQATETIQQPTKPPLHMYVFTQLPNTYTHTCNVEKQLSLQEACMKYKIVSISNLTCHEQKQ